MTVSITKQKPSLKSRTIATIVAVFSAVALPQIVHLLGRATGLGTALGEMLLPMHLPIILAGLLMGPYVAGIAGIL
ncbi:MAG: ECF transporter S component, partial [Ruminococcus sp.]|nr:ECF transporter S component [Ruminococcus sp.]